jgi:TolB-like protein/Flp pilus assembly protein TadD
MPPVELKLLGGFELSVVEPLTLPTRKAEALLAYLATFPGLAHRRDKLVSLLWGERGDTQARHNLAQTILVIRKALGNEARSALVSSGQSVYVEPSFINVDVEAFETLAAKQTPDSEAAAIELYRGTFLDGISVREQAFEDWLRGARDRLNSIACNTLERILERRIAAGDDEHAIEAARRLIELDPFLERAHRSLMRSYHHAGHETAALHQYQVCAGILRDELGIEPDAETKALYIAISKERMKSQNQLDATGEAVTAQSSVQSSLDKPSIAILPFENLSGDADQEYIADGMTEDITTSLSRFRSLFVIARSSTFAYKGKFPDVREVACDLGVRYVLEGSVRNAGNRVRISAQLIDATSGNHLWANYFDGNLDDVFDLQDQITEQIVVAVEPEIHTHERERAGRKPPDSLGAWELMQRGLSHFYRVNKTDRAEAIRIFKKVVALNPEFAAAHAHLAYALSASGMLGYAEDMAQGVAAVRAAAEKAVSLDPNEPMGHYALGRAHIVAGEIEMAIGEMQNAISINPNFPRGHYGLGFAYHFGAGQAEQALPYYDTALRLSPRDPTRWVTLMFKGSALRFLGRHQEAIAHCRQACQFPNAGFQPHMHLAASLAAAGQDREARVAVEKAVELEPALSIGFVRSHFFGMHETILKDTLVSLRKAGVPE